MDDKDDVPVHEGWIPISTQPAVKRMKSEDGKDNEKLISYLEYLDKRLPGKGKEALGADGMESGLGSEEELARIQAAGLKVSSRTAPASVDVRVSAASQCLASFV